MTHEEQRISDDGDLRRYRTELPNLADDELDPYEFRLYAHYKRVCGGAEGGACWETVRTTAGKTKMSIGQVVETRNRLAASGWITIYQADDSSRLIVTIVDRWAENFQRYAPPRSPDEADVHPMNDDCSPGERHLKNEPDLTDEEETPEEELQLLPPATATQTPAREASPPDGSRSSSGPSKPIIIHGIPIPPRYQQVDPAEVMAQEGFTLTGGDGYWIEDWLAEVEPLELIAAILNASLHNARNWSYINRTLENWQHERSPAETRDVARFKRKPAWDEVEH